MAQWIRLRTLNCEVPGSNLAAVAEASILGGQGESPPPPPHAILGGGEHIVLPPPPPINLTT